MALRSTFAAFETAKSGLFMAQKQMDVTTHNMANVNTVGYTRQMFVQRAIDPYGNIERFPGPTRGGKIGLGTEPMELKQIRDAFLDIQFRQEFATEGQYEIRNQGMYYIEDIFNEIGDTSLDKLISDFFQSFSTTSGEKPNDDEYRTIIRSSAELLISQFHIFHSQLEEQQLNFNKNIETVVGQINDIAEQIDSLNDRIFKFELTGEKALDLRDQRNLLLDELSKLTSISYSEDHRGRVTVQLEGRDLVFPRSAATDQHGFVKLEVGGYNPPKYAVDGTTELNCIYWTDYEGNLTPPLPVGGPYDTLEPSDGALRGYFDVRDGVGPGGLPAGEPVAKGIPYYLNQLNKLAEAIVKEVNAVHSQGWSKNTATPPANNSAQGYNFFDITGVTAKTIDLSAAVKADLKNIALSSEKVEEDGQDINTGNGLNAQKLYDLFEKKDLSLVTDVKNFAEYYSTMIADLSVEAGRVNTTYKAQAKLVSSVDTQRAAVSSVSMDEETANLVMFQHAYNAAARCLTALDEALEHLIMRTGRVGL
ncbi:flagellar hook-associated protein FlgK [Oscillospiraceae bacterium OttesenSCG-928-G22]|nr:flagellar hook-associated protein FlgK [Oscillospiraceae bacterium OttesenSCG-928-G22]